VSEGPIREHYLVTAEDTGDETQRRTEIGWPVFRTAPMNGPAGLRRGDGETATNGFPNCAGGRRHAPVPLRGADGPAEDDAIRELLKLTERPDVISFAGGLPAAELFPVEEFAEACARTLRDDGPAALQYMTTEGYLPLRRWVSSISLPRTGSKRRPSRC